MYYQGEVEKNDRRKIITVATAIIVVVLILIVAIIVVATKKSGNDISETDNGSYVITGNENQSTEAQPEAKTETVATVLSTETTTSAETTSKEVPDTGPEDTLPMILAFGSLTTAATAYAMSFAKREA